MMTGSLGRLYEDGDVIIREGEDGNCMFVVQEGRVEVVRGRDDREIQLAVLSEGDFFGEMTIFERDARAATVRALGKARVLTVDKKSLLRRIHEDPSMAFRIIEALSGRIRRLDEEVERLRSAAPKK